MTAYSTGSSWSFPEDVPGTWTQDDLDAQLHPTTPPVDLPEAKSKPEASPFEPEYVKPKTEPPPPPPQPSNKRKRTHYPPRTCRICLEVVDPTFTFPEPAIPLPEALRANLPEPTPPTPHVTYESPPGDGGRLLRPCRCRGTQSHVHEECLSAWRLQNPTEKRNYFQCPTCLYKYRLQRLTYASYMRSTASQLVLTVAIFVFAMFVLGFVADPIINLYLDPVGTIATAGGPRGSLIYDEDEGEGWGEHFIKGLASLGLLGFAKFLLTLSPFHSFNMRGTGVAIGGGRHGAQTGRERLQQLSWLAVAVGVATFLWAVWKGVRVWVRRGLERAGERVLDVDVPEQEEEEEEEGAVKEEG